MATLRSQIFVAPLALLLSLLVLGAPARAAEDFQTELDATIKQLQAESEKLDDLDAPSSVSPKWKRPHPLMRTWGPERAELVLKAITNRYSGNDQRDAYIRYHLIYVVEKHLIDALAACHTDNEPFASDKFRPDPGVIRRLDTLASTLPPAKLSVPWKDEGSHEPEDIWRQYNKIRSSTRVVVGIPPFVEEYFGSEALPHVSGARKQQVEAAIEQMNVLKPQFKWVAIPGASRFNDRVAAINLVLREYRARVVMVLLQSGEEKYLKDVLQATEAALNAESKVAFDLLDAMYIAMFDGYFALYDPQITSRFGRDLERLGASYEKWVKYPRIDGGRSNRDRDFRNFAEAVFTLSQLMQEYYKIEWLARTAYEDMVTPVEAVSRTTAYQADLITSRDIEQAVSRGSNALNNPPSRQSGRFLPYTEPGSRNQRRGEVPERIIDPLDDGRNGPQDDQWQINRAGNQALAAWAQLEAGGHYLSPDLYRRLYWSLSRDTMYTFDRSMRLQMLSNVPSDEFRPWVRRDALWLYSALSDKGNFPNKYTGGKSDQWGDHATGSYGVLGLWAANRAGAEPNLNAIGLIDKHWRVTQDKSGGWSVLPLNVNAGDSKLSGGSDPTSPMTAAGLATLTLTERYLRGKDMASLGGSGRSEELLKSLAWLDKNFSMPSSETFRKSGKSTGTTQQYIDFYYYMWTMQRVSHATGYQSFNGINLSRTVTAEILNRQKADGTWDDKTGRSSDLVSTCFAMLYLADALRPAGIAKLRYDGPWDNRPNDIWNFSDYLSDVFEAPVTWQIVTPREPLSALVASPVLYLSTDGDAPLDDKALKQVRAYIEAGGLLMLNADGNKPKARTTLDRLAESLFPELRVADLPSDHPINSILYDVNLPTKVVSNGVRPLVLLPGRDLSEALQKNETDDEAFKFLSNVYLYAVGRVTRRSRLDDSYLALDPAAAKGLASVKAARLDAGPGSNPEPEALPQLRAFMVEQHKVDLSLSTVKPEALSADTKLAFLTITDGVTLTEAQGQKIMAWVEGGGTLMIDAAGGTAEAGKAMGDAIAAISGGQPGHVVASFDPIINGEGLGATAHNNSRVSFNRYTTFNRRVGNSPLLRAIDVEGRPGIVFSNEDLSATLAGVDHWGLQGYTVESARRLVANVVLAARK